jgi:hypothetical protein
MALLNRIRSSRGVRLAATVAVAVALTGCVIFEAFQPRAKRFAFSHRVHVVDQELDCDACHVDYESAEEPGLPSLKQCALCHGELDSEKPPERRVEVFYGVEGFLAARAGALGDEPLFSHLKHVESGLDCAMCHVGIENNDDVLDLARPSMAACVDCHAQRAAPNECATCHSVLREDVAPPSHDTNWMRAHGSVVCARDDATESQCSMCHNESSCVGCHNEMPPANHTNQWRLRGHGVSASLDRESCATCHREDSCTACHMSTAPRNHTGAWGSPVNQHCVGCHFPVQNEGCVVCHLGTPSHNTAPPKPPDHHPAMNCRQCHGVDQPLPHVDNGDNCNLCHH